MTFLAECFYQLGARDLFLFQHFVIHPAVPHEQSRNAIDQALGLTKAPGHVADDLHNADERGGRNQTGRQGMIVAD